MKPNLEAGSWGMENLRSTWISVAGSAGWKDSVLSARLTMFQFVEKEEGFCPEVLDVTTETFPKVLVAGLLELERTFLQALIHLD